MNEIEQVEQSPTIQRATDESRQPRFSETQERAAYLWRTLVDIWSKDAIKKVPPYTPDSRALDSWLSDFWRTEPLMAGVVSGVVSIDKNRGWTLTGGRNQVNRFLRVLRETEDGAGWRRYSSMQSESFWTTNMGAVTEIGRLGVDGPMGSLYHVDPTCCRLTGKVTEPLEYTPVGGKPQLWVPGDYFRATSMPSIRETHRQLGYCAVMRALQFIILMVAIYRHDAEMLFAAMPKGLLLMSGIDEHDWETAMEANQERLTAKEREFYAGLSIFFGATGDLDAKLVALSQLPTGFDLREWTDILMYGYALVFGYDPREFWPVSGGTLGTGTETQVQALKATGKGGLDFVLAYQDNLQRELPPTLLFEFEQRNEEGEALEAASIQAYADAVNAMASPSGPGMAETLSPEQRRILYAQRGYIPNEWTLFEEDVTATDVENVERERLLSLPQIHRACTRYPDEPIVRATWHWQRGLLVQQLWASGAKALTPVRTYSIPGAAPVARQTEIAPETVYYDSDDITITGEDVLRALKKWDTRHAPDWAGLPNATVEEQA